MSKFSSFLSKHAGDLRVIGSALSVLTTLAFDRQDKEKISAAVATVINAADSIEASIKSVKEATSVKVSPAQLKAAVVAAMPELLAEAAASAVREYMEEQAKLFPPIVERSDTTQV